MKRTDFLKRIGSIFAALFAGITGATKAKTWGKTYLTRDGVTWEEVSLPGKSSMQNIREESETKRYLFGVEIIENNEYRLNEPQEGIIFCDFTPYMQAK